MKSDSSILKLRFVGEGISPSSFTTKELGELLIELQKGMSAFADSFGDSDWSDNDHLLSLIEIKNQSNGLYFSSNYPHAKQAYHLITEAANNMSLYNLPRESFTGIKMISKLAKNKKCNAEISFSSGMNQEYAVITPDDNFILPEEIYLKDTKEFYGEITRIGGAEPRVRFKTFDGKTVNGDISKELAIKIAGKLYQTVKITADVKWVHNSSEMEIKVTSVEDFQVRKNVELFENLRQSLGDFANEYGNNPERIINE